jgi:hypothetical protein
VSRVVQTGPVLRCWLVICSRMCLPRSSVVRAAVAARVAAQLDHDRPLMRPDVSPVGANRVSVVRCCRSLPLVTAVAFAVAVNSAPAIRQQPAPCRGWPAPGPGRLRPGPYILAGVSAEVSGIKHDFACTLTGAFPPVLVVLRAQSCLMLEGRTRTLSGPFPDRSLSGLLRIPFVVTGDPALLELGLRGSAR